MRAFKRTSNHDRTTDQLFSIDKSFTPPPFSSQFGRRFFISDWLFELDAVRVYMAILGVQTIILQLR